MRIPKKISIGGTVYTVKQKRVVDWSNSKVGGQIDYGHNIIRINKKHNSKTKVDTFFHEIAHGVLKELEFNYPKINAFRTNETLVQELGLTLRKTFLDLLKTQEEMNHD